MKLFNRKTQTSAGLGLALLLGGLGITALAQPSPPASPVGMWDLKMSQARRGTAYIIFGEDFSVTGEQIYGPVVKGFNTYVPNPKPSTSGSASLNGWWAFDHAGRVVGSYTESASDGTNVLFSNPVSFTANVKPGSRIKLTTTLVNGQIVILKGVPAVNLPDISGSYLAHGVSNDGMDKLVFTEFFNMQSSGGLIPNQFDIIGTGAGGGVDGHLFTGHALLSANKQISMMSDHVIYNVMTNYIVIDTNTLVTNIFATNYWVTNIVIRQFTGPINLKKFGPTGAPVPLIGLSSSSHILYKISPQAPAPTPE